MASYAQLVPLIVFIPLIGFLMNIFWGARLGNRWPGYIGSAAAVLAFVVALLLQSYLWGNHFEAAIVNPPILESWIRIPSIGLEFPWQMRVDTLSVTMMLVVTGVGSLIHIYAIGYMENDPRFSRFFAYLNLFLVFMLILVTGNNFLMMFVGWEGVGLCSYLLIGFWFDKPHGEGWRNSNAARKAMIVNRIGDFGLLMGVFLIFWTFGTLDYYRPGELANPHFAQELAEEAGHEAAVEGEGVAAEGEIAAPAEAEHEEAAVAEGEGEHGADEASDPAFTDNEHISTEMLGVFGQAERMLADGAEVNFGPFTLPIETVLVLITLFMLLGAAGKSAQIPLFVWLPDAMAGPTPVSALIHAATMVTAGVYMMVRANVFYESAELTSLIVALIGASTAIVAGFIAVGQWDIKRVLAYSTISQLGFMVAAVGVGAYGAAMFHLVTHAFFKGLLFLGSGSVIHGLEHGHHEVAHGHHADAHHADFDPQDMRNMGGLRSKMPITYWTYVIGTLALAGIFPFAGFWSKDEILADSWLAGLNENNVGGYIALGILLAAAGFTAFYMWRQVELVFHGQPRTEAAGHAHESTPYMTVPLIILAFFSIFGGFFNTPSAVLGLDSIFGAHLFTHWLQATLVNLEPGEFQLLIALGALGVGLFAIFLARNIYGFGHALTADRRDPLEVRPGVGAIWYMANARLWWDETYYRLFEGPFNRIAVFLADTLDWAFWHDYFHNEVIVKGFNAIGNLLSQPVDLGVVDGVVNGLARLVRWFSDRLRRVQTGYVRTYAIAVLLGVVFVIVVLLLPLVTNAGN